MDAKTTPSAKPRAIGKPIWPKVPAEFVRAMLAGHSALGLAFAALIYLVCFSGSIAVFTQEYTRWEQPAGPVLQHTTPQAVDRAFRQALAINPAAHDLLIQLPQSVRPRLTVHLDDARKAERTFVADASGAIVGELKTHLT